MGKKIARALVRSRRLGTFGAKRKFLQAGQIFAVFRLPGRGVFDMGDSPLRFPAPSRPSLLGDEFKLKLDPALFPPTLNLSTSWFDSLNSRLMLDPMTLGPLFPGSSDAGTMLRVHPKLQVSLNQPAFCPVPADASFPDHPEPADLGTFVKAVMACKGVQTFMKENLEKPVKHWWDTRSSGTQTGLIITGVTGAVVLEAGFLASVMPDGDRRKKFLPLVDGKRIALPKFDWGPVGVQFHLGPTSGQIDLQPKRGPKFELSGGLLGPKDVDTIPWNVNLMVDFMPLITGATGGSKKGN